MLKVDMELNMVDEENDYCSPVVIVTEDNSDDVCYIVLEENELRVVALLTKEALEEAILNNYKTVAEVKIVYGE